MGFWRLLEVASMPILQLLIISGLGATLATDYIKILPADARRYLNKVVFVAFTPSLTFASLARTVKLEDIISWWFMPVNIGLTFLVGTILGWIVIKLLKPKPHLEGLILASCAAGNLGNLPLIIVPAICAEEASPFGDRAICSRLGLSYVSFSMALGGFYIWTIGYHMIRSSAKKLEAQEALSKAIKEANNDVDADLRAQLIHNTNDPENPNNNGSGKAGRDQRNNNQDEGASFLSQTLEFLHTILEELLSPPIVGAIFGLIFGAITWLRNLLIGDKAPLRVIQDSIQLLGNGTIPCITLILGGNLIEGLRGKALVPKQIIIGIICVKFVFCPIIGIGVVQGAAELGLLPDDPLFLFVLMLQFTVPPAMNLGTIAQLFNVGEAECSMMFLWTYVAAAFALTIWSTVFMWILT
ncbi:PREDICTED: protein PIN-LIKES 7-like isoform X2 [Ipomoea nil]|uniref:protein PIN-LIKES 7-like isoform X2 n=1 Tax=Ipomoea nil TaxID=35883 RepID=UPI0009012C34|nr:PREDICTED: protein PIN-LIKES 7-like isoform X2 [Ipomoea nil]